MSLGVWRDFREVTRRELKRQAPIADAVFVPAFEALPGTAEQQRSGSHHRFAAGAGAAVLKGAGGHDRDDEPVVLLFETPVLGTTCADDILHAPAGSGGDDARSDGARLLICRRLSRSRIDRNFCQDQSPRGEVQLLSRKGEGRDDAGDTTGNSAIDPALARAFVR